MSSSVPLLLGAFLLGLFGSVHCLAMCGGIAGALGQTVAPAAATPDGAALSSSGTREAANSVGRALLYSAGRLASYAIAGGIAGFLGQAFAEQTGLSVGLRIVAGLLILLFGLYVSGVWNGLARIEAMGQLVWPRLAPLVTRVGAPDRTWKIFALGMLWGWLPCGLAYSAIAGAAASGRALVGAVFMLCFGLGTLPAMLAVSALGERVGAVLANRAARKWAGALLLGFGIWSIAGALMPLMHAQTMHGAHAPGREAVSVTRSGKGAGAHVAPNPGSLHARSPGFDPVLE